MIAETCRIEISGGRLRAKRITGASKKSESAGPVLVFLHEGLGCIEHWRGFPERLCENTGLDGLVYDRKGYGGSEPAVARWSKDYLIEEATRDLPELLQALGIEDAVLIGHSDGGTIALLAAATGKTPARGVIAEAAHIFVEEETVRGIRKFMEAYEQEGLKGRLARFHGDDTDMVVKRWAARWLAPDFRQWNIESRLPRISCPVLAIQGVDDEYATKRQVEGILTGVSGPASSEMIPDCGHTPHFQARDHVLALASDFIQSLERGDRKTLICRRFEHRRHANG